LRLSVITLFPDYFKGPTEVGLLGKAVESGRVAFSAIDLREFGEGRHRTTDDYPYGGGAGMVMKPGPLVEAIEKAREAEPDCRVVLLTPKGRRFSQKVAEEFVNCGRICLVCGRYEGFDERIRPFCDDEITIGDFILMGGEAAAAVVMETCSRLVPGVLGDFTSTLDESLSEGLLEYPQYTRPRVFRDMPVPEVLLNGNHAEIAAWRRKMAIRATAELRPDLLGTAELSDEERKLAESASTDS